VPTGDVSIVIPTWNGRHLLEEFLPSVIAAAERFNAVTGGAIEIVVVDDGSTDGTREWLDTRAATTPVALRSVRLDRNAGFAAAANRGVRDARHPLVLLLNNDLEIDCEAILPLVRHFTDDRLFAVHCRAIDASTGRTAGRGQTGRFRRGFLRVHESFEPGEGAPAPFRSLFASGGSAMFSRHRFLELGGFDELFAPYYYEDVELSYRAWKRGLDVHYEPASTVRHRFSSTIGRLRDARVERISFRNRLLLHWIHLHDRRWLAMHVLWVPAAAIASLATLRGQRLFGMVDAIGRLSEVRPRRTRERAAARRSDRQVIELTRR
jgi:GT2 family glycosyltransferase